MALLKRHEPRMELFDWSPDLFGRIFPEWWRRPFVPAEELTFGDTLRVEEFVDGGTMVVRADVPGIDPENDVTIEVLDGMLRIAAERRAEEKVEKAEYIRRELRYGSFERTLPLPEGVTDTDVTATYHDGVLEVRVPMPKAETPEPTRVPITKT